VVASSITETMALMTEVVKTFEMSVNFYQTTQRNNLEDSRL
jgi:hypothetical protein